MRNLVFITSTLALAAATLAGCSAAPEGSSEPVATTQSPILGGAATNDPKYQAVGAIYIEVPELEFFDVICSATLVAPQAIVTARHCTPLMQAVMDFGGTVAMVFGANAFAPDQMVPIVDIVNAPPSPNKPGLLLDGGRDVAVAHLASVPEGIIPAKLGQYEGCMLGKKFEIVGYGAFTSDFFYGEKFVGTATARAHAGHWYRLLFNHKKQDFLDWYFTDAATNPTPAEAEEWWDVYKLESHYELLAGGLPGEAVACFGDSGGPIARGTNASNFTTYGVSFAVEASRSELCTRGGGYAVFNKHMLDFVKSAL